jgi:hypothetical protein
LIKYSTDIITQDESEPVDSLSDESGSCESPSLAAFVTCSTNESQDADRENPATSMGTFAIRNEQRTHSPIHFHPRFMQIPLDTPFIDLDGPRRPRETLEEQNQVSGLQSRGEQNVTEVEQSPTPSVWKRRVRWDSPSLWIGKSTTKTPCHQSLIPARDILKQQTEQFPENFFRAEGVASHEDATVDGIPPEARFTNIPLSIVNLDALIASNERFDLNFADHITVYRVLSEEEIQSYYFLIDMITGTRPMLSQSPGSGKADYV